MADKSRTLASLPWELFENNPNLTLEASAVFNNVEFGSEEGRRKNLAVFKSFNEWFPFYIPFSHHNMCVNKIVRSSPNGKYWTLAIHFLIANKSLDLFAWKTFQDRLKRSDENTNSNNSSKLEATYSLSSCLLSVFTPDENPAHCLEEAEFFNSPWVQQQLPFQPALFHQWLVAFSAEYTKITNEMAELLYMPVGAKDELTLLKSFYNFVGDFINHSFTFLQICTNSSGEKKETADIEFPCTHLAFRFLSLSLKNPITNTSYLTDVIRSHKKLVWANMQQVPSTEEENKGHLGKPSNIYNLDFWTQPSPRRWIFFDVRRDVLADEKYEDITDDEFDRLLEILQSHCFDRINLEDKTKNLLKRDILFKKALLNLRRCEDNYSNLMIRREEQGIVGAILRISMDSHKKQGAAFVKRLLCNATSIQPRSLLRDNFDVFPDEILAREFQNTNIFEPAECFTLDELTEKAKKHRFGGQPISNQCPGYMESPNKIALQFEARIVRLVIDRIKTCKAKILAKRGKLVHSDLGLDDWHFLQYILPCFVASLLETFSAKDQPKEEMKAWYVKFVHNLISAYESRKICPIKVMEDYYFASYIQKQFSSPILLRSFFRSTINEFFAKIDQDLALSNHFKTSLRYGEVFDVLLDSTDSRKQDLSSKHSQFDTLALQFFQNIHAAITEDDLSLLKTNKTLHVKDINDFIQILCHVGFYPSNIIDGATHKDLSTGANLLLGLVEHYARVQGATSLENLGRTTKCLIEAAKKEIKHLSDSQVQFLAFYLAMKLVPREKFLSCLTEEGSVGLDRQSTGCALDYAFKSFVEGRQMWFLRTFFNLEIFNDFKVSFDFVKEKAPTLYCYATKYIEGNRLKMHDPDETWYFPIKHCRKCGALDKALDHQCQMCIFSEDYPDKNFFCSAKCSQEAKYGFHEIMHMEYVLYKKLPTNEKYPRLEFI